MREGERDNKAYCGYKEYLSLVNCIIIIYLPTYFTLYSYICYPSFPIIIIMSNDQNHTSPFPTPIPTDNSTSSLLTLPDGRQLGYAQYGVRTGKPIFFLHGLPGSRLEGAYFDALGKELGAWIIAPDRPGCGWSSRGGKGRRVMDWAGDVEVLAGELGIGKFAVMVREIFF